MIFDFYLFYKFSTNNKPEDSAFKSLKEQFYTDIKGCEIAQLIIENGYYSFLYRGNMKDSYTETENLTVWIFWKGFCQFQIFRILWQEALQDNGPRVSQVVQ